MTTRSTKPAELSSRPVKCKVLEETHGQEGDSIFSTKYLEVNLSGPYGVSPARAAICSKYLLVLFWAGREKRYNPRPEADR